MSKSIIQVRVSLIVIGLMSSPFVLAPDRMTAKLNQAETQRAETSERREEANDWFKDAREEKRLSRVAMERVQGNCPPHVIVATGTLSEPTTTPSYFDESMEVVNKHGQPVLSGLACSETGHTAEIVNGQLVKIARVAAEDKAEYLKFFEMQKQRSSDEPISD